MRISSTFLGSAWKAFPDSKVHGANTGPIWDRQDPGVPHVGPMNIAIWIDQIAHICRNVTGVVQLTLTITD